MRHLHRASSPGLLAVLSVVLGLLPVFLTKAIHSYSLTNRVLAWALLALCMFTAAVRIRREVFPLLEMVLVQYAVSFALPVFYEERLQIYVGMVEASPRIVNVTLLAAILSVIGIVAGYLFAESVRKPRLPWAQFHVSPQRLFALGCVLTVGSVVVRSGLLRIPPSLSHPAGVLLSANLGLAALALLMLRNQIGTGQRIVVGFIFVFSTVFGLVGGMTQAALQPVLIWLVCTWIARRKFSWRFAAALLLGFFVLQPVKSQYRQNVWYAERELSFVDKARLYSTLVTQYWVGERSKHGNQQAIVDQVRISAAQRLSMLLMTAHYVSWTPRVIDFRDGKSLLYPLYGWIPRVIWPDKPIAQEANKQLPVEYGVQRRESLGTTMFGVGHVAETYVTIGIAGLLPIFFLFGIMYFLPQFLLVPSGSTVSRMHTAPLAILVGLAVEMMYIGSTVGSVFGSIVPQAAIQVLMIRALATHALPLDRSVGDVPMLHRHPLRS